MARYVPSIQPDTTVRARDGILGTVADVVVAPETNEISYLIVKVGWFGERLYVPAQEIERVSETEVVLRGRKDDVMRAGADIREEGLARLGNDEVRVPLYEERLRASKRLVDLGEARITKRVEQQEEVVRQPVQRDDLIVERVPINRIVDGPTPPREEDGWYVLPIFEEVLVLEKRLMLREEVRVRKQTVTVEGEAREIRRREVIDVDLPAGLGQLREPDPVPSPDA